MRTFGALKRVRKDKRWVWQIQAEPHVITRVKRMFKGGDDAFNGKLTISDTDEICRDLQWVLTRYPLVMSEEDAAYLEAQSTRYDTRTLEFTSILEGNLDPRPFELAIPAREYQKIAAELILRTPGLLCADDLGLGKGLVHGTVVHTPNGGVPVESLCVGDILCNTYGTTSKVTGVYPQGVQRTFKVSFSDGTSLETDGAHRWFLQSSSMRRRGGGRVFTTEELLTEPLRNKPSKDGWTANRWFLPQYEPIEGIDDNLLVDPYVLGVVLGDGGLSNKSTVITNPSMDVLQAIKDRWPNSTADTNDGCLGIRIHDGHDNWRALGLSGTLSYTKFIPSQYKTASVGSRKLLLAGLLDTDGECSADGGVVTFSTSSPDLAQDVLDLVRSLGGVVSLGLRSEPKYMYKCEKLTGKPSYRLNIRTNFNPFLHRMERYDRWRTQFRVRSVISVEECTPRQTTCISVDAENKLFIAGDYVPTHNTLSAIASFCEPSTRPVLVVTMTHLTIQWQNEIAKFAPNLKTHLVKKGTPYPLTTKRSPQFPDVIIMNYHKVAGWASTLAGVVNLVVFDEGQELRRNTSDKYKGCKVIADAAKYRVALTSTPIYNYGIEFFNLMDVLLPGKLGTQEEFTREWCFGAGDKVNIKDPVAFGAYLREQGMMIRRTRKDVNREIPGINKIIHHVDCDEKALNTVAKDVAELAKFLLRQGGSGFDKMKAGGELDWRLRQATGIAKAPFAAEFIKLLLESGEPVLVYCWHHAVYDILEDKLKEYNPVRYTGEESIHQKEKAKQDFISGKSRVMLISLRAGAGMDGLQHACRTVVYVELDWSPGVLMQATARVARDGQQDVVMEYFLVSDEGSDPVMSGVLGIKRAQLEGVRDMTTNIIEEVPLDKIRQLAEDYLKRAGIQLDTVVDEIELPGV